MTNLEQIRRTAYDHMLVLSPGDEPEAFDASTLAPSDRETAYQIAARRLAFQVLYELDVGGERPDGWVEQTVRGVEGLGPILCERTLKLIHGTSGAKAAADAEFHALAPDWPPHRLAAVDRAILRLAHYEMTSGTTSPRVVINEAVELAKHYSTDRSPAFINGLLDRVYRRIAPDAAEPAKAEPAKAEDGPTGGAS